MITGCGTLTSVNTSFWSDELAAGIRVNKNEYLFDQPFFHAFTHYCEGDQMPPTIPMTSETYPVITWIAPTLQGSGDLNGDGKTDIADMVLMGNHLSGDNDLDNRQFVIADVLRNNNVSILDVVNLANMIVGG